MLDTLTDLAARYMYLLAQSAVTHATINQTELEITVQDVRMAMQDCGALAPEKVLEEQEFDGEEDIRGVDDFLAWATGAGNREIRRVALEGGDGAKEDYLTGLLLSGRRLGNADYLQFSKRNTVPQMKIQGTMERSWARLPNLAQSRLKEEILAV